MFLDEARLSLHLNHANVVQTFDIGSSDDAYFIVMEWVDGVNLKGVLESLTLSGVRLPIEQAIFIAIEVCKGLYHAHRRSTPDGEPLNIVHRDVSPPNVLISREGEVKLVDFGLAKAATQAFSTDQGMIKGKFSYLSPEAAWGKPVDERADIFAVGAILWEMLAGRKLFEGKSNKETVLMVRDAEVPSLEPYNPYIDERLMGILRRSLAREAEERFSTAKELAKSCHATSVISGSLSRATISPRWSRGRSQSAPSTTRSTPR
jgi:serine/threonine-protein kinase